STTGPWATRRSERRSMPTIVQPLSIPSAYEMPTTAAMLAVRLQLKKVKVTSCWLCQAKSPTAPAKASRKRKQRKRIGEPSRGVHGNAPPILTGPDEGKPRAGSDLALRKDFGERERSSRVHSASGHQSPPLAMGRPGRRRLQ